jgi:hypothetical protein
MPKRGQRRAFGWSSFIGRRKWSRFLTLVENSSLELSAFWRMAHMKTHNSQEQRSKQNLAQRYKPIGIKAVAAAVRTEDKKAASQNREQRRQGSSAARDDSTKYAPLAAELNIKVE